MREEGTVGFHNAGVYLLQLSYSVADVVNIYYYYL